MNFVAGTIEESGIDKHHTLARAINTLGQIERGAPLLIHDANFERVLGQP